MKKFISIALGMVLALSTVACSSNGGSASDTSENSVSYEGTYEELLEMAETVELNTDTFEQYFGITNYEIKNQFDEVTDYGICLKSKLYDDGYIILNTYDELEDISVGISIDGGREFISSLGYRLSYIGSCKDENDMPSVTFTRVTNSKLKILPLDYVISYNYCYEDFASLCDIEFINGYTMECESRSPDRKY